MDTSRTENVDASHNICFLFFVGEESSEEEQLGFLVVEALTYLLSGNSQNAAVFRESGGAKCAIALVPFLECRLQALGGCLGHP